MGRGAGRTGTAKTDRQCLQRKKGNHKEVYKNLTIYYELSKEHIAIINRKCHDLKHQLKALAAAADSQRAEYIKETQESIEFYFGLDTSI